MPPESIKQAVMLYTTAATQTNVLYELTDVLINTVIQLMFQDQS